MEKYRCKYCNYCFEWKLEKFPKVCPNCGETEAITKEKSAEDLIEGIE